MKITIENIQNFNINTFLNKLKEKVNTPFFHSFIISFLILNIIFIYHGTHFLFGDHDWKYFQTGISLKDGFFEGRFSQFIHINLLTYGKILPIINNFFGFLGFSLGISLLAKYWELPNNSKTYILFSLFTSITPFILSFMYFSFIIIPCLSWNAIIISSLIISSKEITFDFKKTLSSSILITLAFGGYPPVINLFIISLLTKIFIDIHFNNLTLKDIIKNYTYTIINLLLGIIIYKLCIKYLTHIGAMNTNYYNLQTIPLNQYLDKFFLITKDLFKQFIITLPFIPLSYKIPTLCITILAILSIHNSPKKYNIPPLIKTLIFIGIFYASLITLFLSTSTEETEFAPRIDFFGLMYIYSAMFMLCLKSSQINIKNLSTLLAILSIFISINQILEAQKVWKLGFDAELQNYTRIIRTYEQQDNFDTNKKYTIVQGGLYPLRTKYYHTPYNQKSDDLLNTSYIPGFSGESVIQYQTIPTYLSKKPYIYTFSPNQEDIKKIIKASSWPHKDSIYIGDYWIMLILNHKGLTTLRRRYLHTQIKEP